MAGSPVFLPSLEIKAMDTGRGASRNMIIVRIEHTLHILFTLDDRRPPLLYS
jgi:hypothetical protein